jgi:hypothetical protein
MVTTPTITPNQPNHLKQRLNHSLCFHYDIY